MSTSSVCAPQVVDNWHHPSDVCAGFALGMGVSLIVYLQHYPWFFHEHCGTPVWELVAQVSGTGGRAVCAAWVAACAVPGWHW